MKRIVCMTAIAAVGLALFSNAMDTRPATPAATVAQEPKPEAKKEPPKEEKKDEVKAAEVGKAAPDFELADLDGKKVKLSDYKGKIVVLEWFNPDCPTCDRIYSKGGPLTEVPERLKKDGVVWLAVNSDGATAKEVDKNKDFLKEKKVSVPVLLDPTGKTGKAYGAKSTPHCFVIDEKGVLRYQGALDNAPSGKPKEGEALVNYVEKAVGEIKAAKPVTTSETKSYG
ncbi:MAG: redoxin domain-containing protein [Planctomycetes bacterium]|nr:redoxin domain-containing protein [Planctomycetota bacterium]